MNAKFLLRKYLNTGTGIPEYQFNKLNPNLKTTYIRKRIIAIETGVDVQTFELPYISQDTLIKSAERNRDNIQHIKNPTLELQMDAVKEDGGNIRYIENPTPELQMAAVKELPFNIRHIKNPTLEVQMYVVEKEPRYIRHIKNPNEKVKQYLLGNNINESRMIILINESQLKTIIKDII
jgi:hypothetical protein